MQVKSALILGGAGFIGTHLARELTARESVRRIVSLDIEAPVRPVPRVIYHRHDVRQPLDKTVNSQFDVVFNLAAVHRTPGHADIEYYDTNVAGAINCTSYCERHDIDRLIFTSSISVYGPSEEPLDESAPLNPNSAYGRSKRLAEDIQRAWQERSTRRRLTIVRPAVVFGEGENGNYTQLAQLLRRGMFVYPGRTDTRKAGGYVKELVRTLLFTLARPEPYYLYNFADRECPTIEQICRAFAEHGGMRSPLGVLPLPLVQAAAASAEALSAFGFKSRLNSERVAKLLHSTYIVPQRLIADAYPFAYNLATAISDWVATDEAIRPATTRARPIQVPDLVLAPEPQGYALPRAQQR